MKLKVGDVVVFKNYADMSVYDTALLMEECFPESGKVTDVRSLDKGVEYFCIEGSPYNFNSGSVARLISDVNDHDLGVIRKGDEVLVKAIVKEAFNGLVKINSSVDKNDITKVLKRKPEKFIVQDDHYGMYIIGKDTLSYDKSKAHIFNSREEANEVAADFHLNAWEVIPYDD